MSFSKKQLLFLAGFALLLASFGGGFFYGSHRLGATFIPFTAGVAIDEMPPSGIDAGPLWKAWYVLDEKFVSATTSAETVNGQDKLWGAVKGLAASYEDPYTVFFPPADSQVFQSQVDGNFGGIGIEIGIKNDTLTVIAPLKGTPAERAGILAGDKILKIEEKSTEGMSVDKAVQMIRGPKGTSIALTLIREGVRNSFEVSVERDIIQIPTIDAKLRPDGVFVISLYSFTSNSPNLFREALRQFILSESDKLVLDLRGNPGGYLEAAVDMASWFLPAGDVVVTEDFGGKEKNNIHRSRGYDIFNSNLKMAILINGGSASAAEILAGALREHGVATLVGEKSFGKGSVQELVNITDETSLKVTVAHWLTPKGKSISGNGIEPDVAAARTAEDAAAGEDPQAEKAAALLIGM